MQRSAQRCFDFELNTRGQELATRDTDGYSVRNRTRVSISVGPYRPISDPFSLIFLFIELYFGAESFWAMLKFRLRGENSDLDWRGSILDTIQPEANHSFQSIIGSIASDSNMRSKLKRYDSWSQSLKYTPQPQLPNSMQGVQCHSDRVLKCSLRLPWFMRWRIVHWESHTKGMQHACMRDQ